MYLIIADVISIEFNNLPQNYENYYLENFSQSLTYNRPNQIDLCIICQDKIDRKKIRKSSVNLHMMMKIFIFTMMCLIKNYR